MEQRRRKRLSVAVSFRETPSAVEEGLDGEEEGTFLAPAPVAVPRSRRSPANATPSSTKAASAPRKSIVHFKENDDIVEKRNRRKSRVMIEDALGASPLSPQKRASMDKGKPTTLPQRQSLVAGGLLRRKSLLPRHLPKTQLIELYSECIRLSAENKINQKNSWSLDLIDHIDDVLQSNFNNTEGGGVGNFQAASCTLDASVKIYSYRVDSIHNETYRVLGDLSQTRSGKRPQHDDDDDAGEGADGEGAERQAGKKGAAKKKRRARVDTIEKNPASLLVDDLGFGLGLDPLFRKLSSSFDESGAQGLLLNQLPINQHAEVVLDSSATFMSANAGATEDGEEEESASAPSVGMYTLPTDLVRSLRLAIHDKVILCPPLSEHQQDEDVDDQEEFEPVAFELNVEMDGGAEHANVEPSTATEGLLHTLGLHSLASTGPALGHAEDLNSSWGDDAGDAGEVSFDDSIRTGNDTAMHNDHPLERIAEELEGAKSQHSVGVGAQLASDLESLVGSLRLGASGWAGPAHWKYKPAKTVSRGKTQDEGDDEDKEEGEELASANKKGKKKAPFFIDFDAPPINAKLAFATSRAATTLSQAVLKKAKAEDYMLPRDVKYDYRALCSYFLHPTRTVGSHLVSSAILGQAARYSTDQANQPFDAPPPHAHADLDVDMDTNLRDMDMDIEMGGADSDSDIDGRGGDDYNHVDLEAGPDAPNGEDPTADPATAAGDGGEDKLELVEQPQKINSEAISYARVAKKIDVIALKRALSHQITTSSQKQEEAGISFKGLLRKLPSRIKDRRTLEDLSVQVCFITLLHLANEHDLEITTTGGADVDADDPDLEASDDPLAYPTDLLVHVPERK